uniref:Orf20 n=1 Tax=Streptococcus pneumoniae TaxID=1313 RepID=Q9EZG4_STREE|nr:Orf20 [Streptococcus pneumoniae]
MMYSGKKFLLFSLLGILLGYLFHRLTLLYDSYTGNTLDKWTRLLMEGQEEVLQSPWNISFTGKSSAFFLLGFVMMLLVYLYLETGKKQYREGVRIRGAPVLELLKEKNLLLR